MTVHMNRTRLLVAVALLLCATRALAQDHAHEFKFKPDGQPPKSVHVAGDFNGWSRDATPMTKGGDNAVLRQRFDVLSRPLRSESPDAGTRLAIPDIAGKPLRAWDSRGQAVRPRYDALQRPTHTYVKQGAVERLLLRTVYGEALDPRPPHRIAANGRIVDLSIIDLKTNLPGRFG